MTVLERFLSYVKISTASDPDNFSVIPSSARQLDLAEFLKKEMLSMGIADTVISEHGYVYGSIPASEGCENVPAIGFIAHMDTAPDFCGENVNPRVIENYDGNTIELGSGRSLTAEVFPHLPSLKGKTLVVTDGSTLLGGDDKAGIAAILTAAEKIIAEGKPHGKICIGFTPDEEIGNGASEFDIKGFGADFAYTVDGGNETGIDYENFNACAADFTINGFNVHPGGSKNTMINAGLIAAEINALLPKYETPRDTEGYEGFYHLTYIHGDVEKAEASYIVRDHSAENFKARKDTLRHIEKILNEKYGAGTVSLDIRDQYRNMGEIIKEHFHLVENAQKAIRSLGREPVTMPIRGGTDGATLSLMGLPCPNLGTGGFAAHGPYEHVCVEGMEFVTELICGIIAEYAGK